MITLAKKGLIFAPLYALFFLPMLTSVSHENIFKWGYENILLYNFNNYISELTSHFRSHKEDIIVKDLNQ